MVFCCKFAAYLQNIFLEEDLWGTAFDSFTTKTRAFTFPNNVLYFTTVIFGRTINVLAQKILYSWQCSSSNHLIP